jgi:hypothetical protein
MLDRAARLQANMYRVVAPESFSVGFSQSLAKIVGCFQRVIAGLKRFISQLSVFNRPFYKTASRRVRCADSLVNCHVVKR